jgi:uncharacterized protein (AIM24 family)
VHPGHVGAFDQTVSFSVGTVPGIANKFFGGNGFFLADLTGPGEVVPFAVELRDGGPGVVLRQARA